MPDAFDLMLSAFFNGIGTASGLMLFEFYIRPRIVKFREFHKTFTEDIRKTLKDGVVSGK